MLAISPDLTRLFEALLAKQDIPVNQRPSCHNWLRYYLDFVKNTVWNPPKGIIFQALTKSYAPRITQNPQRRQARQAIAAYYKGIVGYPVARLKNQAEAMAQTKPQFSFLI